MSRSALFRGLLASLFACSALGAGEPRSPSKADSQAASRIDRFGDPLPPFALARLGTSRLRITPRPLRTVLSPNGKTIAISTDDSIILMDAKTGKQRLLTGLLGLRISDDRRRRLPWLMKNRHFDPAFSPDSSLLAAPSILAGSIRLWDAPSGMELRGFTDAKLEREERLIARFDRKQTLVREIARLVGEVAREHRLVFSIDGKLAALLVASDDADLGALFDSRSPSSWITTFDVQRRIPVGAPEVYKELSVKGLAISPDRKTLAWWGKLTDGSDDGMIERWDLQKHEKLAPIRRSGDFDILAATFSPDSRTLATVTGEGTIRLFDLVHRNVVSKLDPTVRMRWLDSRVLHKDVRLLFSADGRQLLLGTPDGAARIWNIADGKPLPERRSPFAGVQSWAFIDGHVAACRVFGDRVKAWDERSGKTLEPEKVHAGPVAALVFSRDGRKLHSVAETGDFLDWDVTSATASRTAMLLSEEWRFSWETELSLGLYRFALSPGGRYAAVVSPHGMDLWDTERKQTVQVSSGISGWYPIAAFLGDSKLLAAGAGRVGVYDVPTGAVAVSFPAFAAGLSCAAVSLDGKLAAGVAPSWAPSRVSIWQTDDGQRVADLRFPEAFLSAANAQGLALSADGQRVAAVATDTVRVCDTLTGKTLARLEEATGTIGPICFSPDGRLLAVGCAIRDRKKDERGITRGAVRLWEIASGSVRTEFGGHDGGVTTLAFSPDGWRLASGSSDTTILIWDVSGDELVTRRDTKLTGAQREALWRQLASPDAGAGYDAIVRLCAAPGDSVELLRSHLRPVRPIPDEGEMGRLMKLLGSRQPAERTLAEERVMEVGQEIVPALRRAINGSPSPELRKRAETLLLKILFSENEKPDDSIRLTRALEVLEKIATPAARQLVRGLTVGRADHPFTLEAKSVLARMQAQR